MKETMALANRGVFSFLQFPQFPQFFFVYLKLLKRQP